MNGILRFRYDFLLKGTTFFGRAEEYLSRLIDFSCLCRVSSQRIRD